MKQSKVTKEEKKPLELCAISKEVAIERLNKLTRLHSSIFEEYDLWVSVINSPIKMVNEEALPSGDIS